MYLCIYETKHDRLEKFAAVYCFQLKIEFGELSTEQKSIRVNNNIVSDRLPTICPTMHPHASNTRGAGTNSLFLLPVSVMPIDSRAGVCCELC